MEFAFYICGLIAILATLRVITHTNPVHALLYLIISLLAISGVFFALGAHFAGALEIIVYAGAIMVLFVFVVMMLNLGGSEIEQERQWLKPQVWIGPAILSAIMLAVIVYAILGVNDQGIDGTPISAKAVGITLFGPYVLAVELASMLLLAGLVVAFHVGREERVGEVLSNRTDDRAKRKRRNAHDPLNTWTDPRCDFIRSGLNRSGYPPQSAVYADRSGNHDQRFRAGLCGRRQLLGPDRWSGDVHSRHQPRGC